MKRWVRGNRGRWPPYCFHFNVKEQKRGKLTKREEDEEGEKTERTRRRRRRRRWRDGNSSETASERCGIPVMRHKQQLNKR